MQSEAKSADLWPLSLTLVQADESFGVLQGDGLYSSHVVEVASELVVGDILWEVGLLDEVSGLLYQVLGQVTSNDDVHDCGLANLILLETARLIVVKHWLSQLRQESKLLICHGDKVSGLGSEMEQSWLACSLQSLNDKVTKLLSLHQCNKTVKHSISL